MIPFTRPTRALIGGLAIALILTACGDTSTDTTGTSDDAGQDMDGALSGTIRLDGSSTVGPLSEVAAELFSDEHPGVAVDVAISGTSGGFQKFCIGENDMNNASRSIKESEIELCGQNNIAYEGVQVANDALSVVVNLDNPIDCLTPEQVSSIWDAEPTATTWGQIEGVEVPEEMADQAITLYGPGSDSGTFDFFTDAINGEEGRIISTYTDIGEDDAAAVSGIETDPYAMGYIPYSYLQEALDQVKPLQIDGGDGCIEATLDNVLSGTYVPLGRPLFVYASDVALAKPEVLAFMEFYVDNSAQIAEIAGFVPMTDDQIAASKAQIASLLG